MAIYCAFIYGNCYMVATNDDSDSACDDCYYYHLAMDNDAEKDGEENEKSD